MKKALISLGILLLINTNLKAQKGKIDFGFLGGLNVSNFYDFKTSFRKEKLKSYAVGGNIGYTLNNMFSIRANLMYEVKGEETNIQSTDALGNNIGGYSVLKLNYTTLHILTRATFGDKIQFYAEAGPYAAYLLNAQAVVIANSQVNGVYYGTFKQDISTVYKSTNFGLTAGIGANYPINKKMGIELTVRRSMGLTSISKINRAPTTYFSDNLKTNSIAVLAGMNFKL